MADNFFIYFLQPKIHSWIFQSSPVDTQKPSHSIKFKKFSWGRHPQTPLATVIVMLTYRYVSTGKLGQCNFASTAPVGKGVSIQVSLKVLPKFSSLESCANGKKTTESALPFCCMHDWLCCTIILAWLQDLFFSSSLLKHILHSEAPGNCSELVAVFFPGHFL